MPCLYAKRIATLFGAQTGYMSDNIIIFPGYYMCFLDPYTSYGAATDDFCLLKHYSWNCTKY